MDNTEVTKIRPRMYKEEIDMGSGSWRVEGPGVHKVVGTLDLAREWAALLNNAFELGRMGFPEK